MGPLLEIIDNKNKRKVRPPKVPKTFKASMKENIINLENLSKNHKRSRQGSNFEKKSITIQHSPKTNQNLEFKDRSMKRKSSYVSIKNDLNAINLNFLKNKKSLKQAKKKKSMNKNHSQNSLKMFSSVADSKIDDSLIDFHQIPKDVSKNSLIEGFNRDKPEIEFVSSRTKKVRNFDSQSISLCKSKIENKRKSKSPTSKKNSVNAWKVGGKKPDGDLYFKNLDSYAKDLVKKMKRSTLVKSDKQLIGTKKDAKLVLKFKDGLIKNTESQPNINLNKVKFRLSKTKLKRSQGSKERQGIRTTNSATTLELLASGISRNIISKKELMTAEIQMKSIENVQNYSDIHESPMPASEVKILHSPDQNTSDSDIVSMQKQFETIYQSQDTEYQPDAFKTQDSQIASKPNKQLKKKNLKRRDGQKVGLNLKQSASSVKRKKRKSSRSKRRGSNSKKRSNNPEENDKTSITRKRMHSYKTSLSPNKELRSICTKAKQLGASQSQLKTGIKIKGFAKHKVKSKKMKLSKIKSQNKLVVKKDKILDTSSRSKKKQKSPSNAFDKLKYHTLEIPQIIESIGHAQSPSNFNTQGDAHTIIPDKSSDFLKFVEEHEKKHAVSKVKRTSVKENSPLSTNTGNTTNIGCTTSVVGLSKKLDQIKLNRPFSGDSKKQEKSQNRELMKKKAPLARPKTAKNKNENLEKSLENKLSSFNPSSHEEEK